MWALRRREEAELDLAWFSHRVLNGELVGDWEDGTRWWCRLDLDNVCGFQSSGFRCRFASFQFIFLRRR